MVMLTVYVPLVAIPVRAIEADSNAEVAVKLTWDGKNGVETTPLLTACKLMMTLSLGAPSKDR